MPGAFSGGGGGGGVRWGDDRRRQQQAGGDGGFDFENKIRQADREWGNRDKHGAGSWGVIRPFGGGRNRYGGRDGDAGGMYPADGEAYYSDDGPDRLRPGAAAHWSVEKDGERGNFNCIFSTGQLLQQ